MKHFPSACVNENTTKLCDWFPSSYMQYYVILIKLRFLRPSTRTSVAAGRNQKISTRLGFPFDDVEEVHYENAIYMTDYER